MALDFAALICEAIDSRNSSTRVWSQLILFVDLLSMRDSLIFQSVLRQSYATALQAVVVSGGVAVAKSRHFICGTYDSLSDSYLNRLISLSVSLWIYILIHVQG